MRTGFVTNAFSIANESLSKVSYQIGRFFTDDNFLDIRVSKTSHIIFQKAADVATKAKRAAQRSSFRVLLQKNMGSSYDYKPTSKVFMAAAQEGLYLLSKASPHLARAVSSPRALTGVAIALGTAGAIYILKDSTALNLLSEQAANIMALLQSDAPEPKQDLGNDVSVIKISTENKLAA